MIRKAASERSDHVFSICSVVSGGWGVPLGYSVGPVLFPVHSQEKETLVKGKTSTDEYRVIYCFCFGFESNA